MANLEESTIQLDWDSSDDQERSYTEEETPLQAQEGTPEEYMTWQVMPWSYPAGQMVAIMPGVSVLNWYLYTGGGKFGFTHGESGDE